MRNCARNGDRAGSAASKWPRSRIGIELVREGGGMIPGSSVTVVMAPTCDGTSRRHRGLRQALQDRGRVANGTLSWREPRAECYAECGGIVDMSSTTERFIQARDHLLTLRDAPVAAQREFRWPRFEHFNWVRDYFDVIARDNDNPALRVATTTGAEHCLTFSQLSRRSSQVANFLAAQGVGRGDRILVMLANVVPLWEVMLAAIKLGAVIIPATTLLEGTELRDRLERGRPKAVVTSAGIAARFAGFGSVAVRIAVGEPREGWLAYGDSHA